MQKLSYWSLIFIFLGTGCSSQSDSNELANTFWTTEILYDKERNEFTPNMIFSFGSATASIHQFGTGEKLLELPYSIENDYLYLDGKPNPFLKFLQKKNDKIIASLYPGDTTILKKVYPNTSTKEAIKSELLNQSFALCKKLADEYKSASNLPFLGQLLLQNMVFVACF